MLGGLTTPKLLPNSPPFSSAFLLFSDLSFLGLFTQIQIYFTFPISYQMWHFIYIILHLAFSPNSISWHLSLYIFFYGCIIFHHGDILWLRNSWSSFHGSVVNDPI